MEFTATDFTAWPDVLAQSYREQGFWTRETLGTQLRIWAATYGDKVAIIDGDDRLTFSELDVRADRLAAGLHERGLRADDRVVVHLPNCTEFVVLCFALFRLGAHPVYALPAHRSAEISYLCEFGEAAAYVIPDVHGTFDYRGLARELAPGPIVFVVGDAAEFENLPDAEPVEFPQPDPAAVALYLLSGGTTGLPKLIPRTHDDYGYNFRASAEVSGLDKDSVYLAVLPIAHNFALACPGVLGTLSAGGAVVLAAGGAPDTAFALIEEHGVTHTALVPSLALVWIEAVEWFEADLSSLRVLQVGGAKFKAEAARQVRPALGCQLQQVFGMAEGLLCYTRLEDSDDIVIDSQGRPMSVADEIRIVDDNDEPVALGELGHLLTRGPYTLRGYFRAAEHNARAFTADGFYRTGDLVRALPSGHLVVDGRAKDLINRGGEKISAEELENHLLAHPAIHDAAAVPVPDDMLGEKTCVFVISRDAAPTLTELTVFLRERGLAEFKLPDRLEVVESFPRTAVGKVSKKELAALARGVVATNTAHYL